MKPVPQGPARRAPGGSTLVRAVMAAAGAVLLLDALVLMALLHFNVGVIVPAMLGAGLLALSARWPQLARWRQGHAGRTWLWRLGWTAFALWVVSVLWFWEVLRGVGMDPADAPPVQAIVVLGSSTRDGQPRPPLAARLDTAAELARLQPGTWVVVSGGVDFGETESEGEVMARYLRERHGLPAERLLVERESTSTDQNFSLSRPLLQARGVGPAAPTAVVTSDFHLRRSMGIARAQGLTAAVPVRAPTPLATRYNAWLREYFATLSSWALREV